MKAVLRTRAVYANVAEDAFLRFAKKRGWRITKRGWPDFLCLSRSGEWFAVEVKPRRRDGLPGTKALKPEQIACMDFLTTRGVRCYVSDGEEIYPYTEKHRRGLRIGGGVDLSKSHIAAP